MFNTNTPCLYFCTQCRELPSRWGDRNVRRWEGMHSSSTHRVPFCFAHTSRSLKSSRLRTFLVPSVHTITHAHTSTHTHTHTQVNALHDTIWTAATVTHTYVHTYTYTSWSEVTLSERQRGWSWKKGLGHEPESSTISRSFTSCLFWLALSCTQWKGKRHNAHHFHTENEAWLPWQQLRAWGHAMVNCIAQLAIRYS